MTVQINEWAPIAVFIYNRPVQAERMISSLQACAGYEQSPLFVFADGPAHPRDLPGVERTRALARNLLSDRAVFLEREANMGVDRSVIAGVTELCNRFGKVVVLEDDLMVSPLFLRFLNGALQRYQDEPRVMQVSGHMFDVPQLRKETAAFFLPMTTSWGWATWKRAWDQFDPVATGWRARLQDGRVRRRFDLNGHFGYSRMLNREMRQQVGAWDIRWYYTVFATSGLVLFPPRTLVVNLGLDGSGTHHRLALPVPQAPLETTVTFTMPLEVQESPNKVDVFDAIGRFRPQLWPRLMAIARFAVARLRDTLGFGSQ